MVRVLILGGTGLISTSITRELLENGYDVVLYNRGKTESRVPSGAKTVIGDRKQCALFESQMERLGNFDCVIDMICFKPEDAQSTIRACRGRTEQIIFCSTVDVYSKPAARYPILEDEPRRGNNQYGRDKILCEDLFLKAERDRDFAVTILRPAMTYGQGRGIVDWQGWGTVVLDRLKKGKPIIVHGDGSALWVAAYADDVAHAFVRAVGNAQTYGKTYHITGEEWMPWNRYYELAAQAVGGPEPELVHIPTDLLAKLAGKRADVVVSNFQGNNIFDNSAARRDLDFQYTIQWREGVQRIYKWLETHNAIENSENETLNDAIIDWWRQVERRAVDLPLVDPLS